MKVRWIDAGRVSGLRSQSIYHGLGHAFKNDSPNTIVLEIPENPYMCVGHFQDPLRELDLAYCTTNNLPIIRRQTGGGVVYIDNRQLFVQWIFQPNSIPQKVDQKFQQFMKPMVETYKFFGINAYEYGGHDVHVNGKKIVGTGAATIGEAEVLTGNFITGFSSKHMVGALKLPNETMKAEVHRAMDEYMSSIASELEAIPEFDEIKNVYKQKCKKILGLDISEEGFTEAELLEIEKQDKKLSSDAWTFSIKQPEKKCRLIKIHAGVWVGGLTYQVGINVVEITIRLNNNKIDYIKINSNESDGNNMSNLLERALINLKLTSDKLITTLDSFFVIHGPNWSFLTKDQWMEALLMISDEKKKISGG